MTQADSKTRFSAIYSILGKALMSTPDEQTLGCWFGGDTISSQVLWFGGTTTINQARFINQTLTVFRFCQGQFLQYRVDIQSRPCKALRMPRCCMATEQETPVSLGCEYGRNKRWFPHSLYFASEGSLMTQKPVWFWHFLWQLGQRFQIPEPFGAWKLCV